MFNKLRFSKRIAVVTSSADFHPLRQIAQLTTDIKTHGFEGFVLFDLLAVNGLTPNRFASMRFNSTEFDRSSFEIASEVEAKSASLHADRRLGRGLYGMTRYYGIRLTRLIFRDETCLFP